MRLVSPVFMKEMVTLARHRRHYFARAVLLGIGLFVVWSLWGSNLRRAGWYDEDSYFLDFSYVGRRLFGAFVAVQLFAVALLTPALTAPVIATEKQRRTLGLLLMTNLSVRHLLLDKLLSRLALMLLLLAAMLPLFLALLAFGGVLPGQIAVAFAYVGGTLLFCGGVGLFWSTILRTMHTALIATYATLIAYFFGVAFASEFPTRAWVPCLLPVLYDTATASQALIFLSLCGVVFLLSLLVCNRLLPRMPEQAPRSLVKRLSDRLNAFFERINFTGVVVMDENRQLGRNAILWKESHKHFFSSNTFLIRCSYSLLMLTLIGFAVLTWILSYCDWDDAALTFGTVAVSLAGVIAVVAPAVSFASERERASLDVLLSTPLDADAIVMAKFVGTMKLLVPPVLCAILWVAVLDFVGGPLGFARHGEHGRLLILLAALASYLPAVVVIGLFSSAQRRRAASALLQTFAIVAAWSLAPLLLVWLESFSVVNVDTDFMQAVAALCPVSAIAWSLFDPDPKILACLILLPAWIMLLFGLASRFDRIVGRR